MSLKEQLLEEAARFCERRGISEARLATLVVNDGKFFVRVRGGGGFTTDTFERFQEYFAANTPGEPTASRKASGERAA